MIATRPAARDASRLRLDGRTALVTGAGRGLGRGIAEAFAHAGADVVLVSRSPAELEGAAEAIRAAGGQARAVPADVRDRAALAELVGSLDALDVLVNNAGTNVLQPFLEVDETTFDELFALNVRATFFAAQVAARRMAAAGDGVIVNVSSQMGHVGAASRSVYCATKHAVEGMTKAMAVELAPSGVRVCALAPTYVETPMTAPFFADPEARAGAEARIPLGRLGRVEDVADAAVFLASPAAALVTGTSLLVDGGYTAQ